MGRLPLRSATKRRPRRPGARNGTARRPRARRPTERRSSASTLRPPLHRRGADANKRKDDVGSRFELSAAGGKTRRKDRRNAGNYNTFPRIPRASINRETERFLWNQPALGLSSSVAAGTGGGGVAFRRGSPKRHWFSRMARRSGGR